MMFCMLHGLLASSVWKPSVHDGKDDSVLMPRVFSVNQMEGLELGRKGTNGGRKGRGHAISRSLKACHALSNALLCQDRGSSPGQVMHFLVFLHDIHNVVQCHCQQQQHKHSHSNNSRGRSSSANVLYSRYVYVTQFFVLKTSLPERRLILH